MQCDRKEKMVVTVVEVAAAAQKPWKKKVAMPSVERHCGWREAKFAIAKLGSVHNESTGGYPCWEHPKEVHRLVEAVVAVLQLVQSGPDG